MDGIDDVVLKSTLLSAGDPIDMSSMVLFSNTTGTTALVPSPFFSSDTSAAALFNNAGAHAHLSGGKGKEGMGAMREMIFRIAAMQPIEIDPEAIKAPRRRNVRISKDPQSVAARQRRERISQKIRILQRLVPGGTKMDTASMLDEAVHYVKFLKRQVQTLEQQSSATATATATAAAFHNLNSPHNNPNYYHHLNFSSSYLHPPPILGSLQI